jgi:hypothetical protein
MRILALSPATAALEARRSADAALVTGTGKDLLEAAARRITSCSGF